MELYVLEINYILFISKLKSPIKIVINVYPHPVQDKLIFKSLQNYGILNSTDIFPIELFDTDFPFIFCTNLCKF